MRNVPLLLVSVVLPLAVGAVHCSPQRIQGTDLLDTQENHAAIDVAEKYRKAVEARDTDALISMASPNYFEDGGTPEGDDDYGLDGLRRLLSVWSEEVRAVRYEMRYRRVEYSGDHLSIDYTYTGSFTLRKPPMNVQGLRPGESFITSDPVRGATPVEGEQEVWYRRVADNRLEFEKIDGQWRIVAGM